MGLWRKSMKHADADDVGAAEVTEFPTPEPDQDREPAGEAAEAMGTTTVPDTIGDRPPLGRHRKDVPAE